MKNEKNRFLAAAALYLVSLIPGSSLQAIELVPSALEQDMHKVRFESVTAQLQADRGFVAQEDQGFGDPAAQSTPSSAFKRKSPLKAFLLSAILPGAGQFYNGGRIKPVVFLGIEAATWMMHFKKEGEADDATTAYQKWNQLYWSRDTYSHYLFLAYNQSDDDSLAGEQGITHHLPDENTQQFYEMTGKYDQFAWGWDDAWRLHEDDSLGLDPYAATLLVGSDLRITSSESAPYSAHRLTYEGMRKTANDLYNTADTWLYITIANHLISGFEAYISAKKHNRNMAESDLEFSKIDMNVSLKSYHAWRDTPYVKLSYKF